MPNYKEYRLVCKYCGQTFIGSFPWTKYCSHQCASKAIKENLKLARIEEDSEAVKEQRREALSKKEFVSLSEAARLLDISRPTLYKKIEDEGIEVVDLGPRTKRIRVADLLATSGKSTPSDQPFPKIQKPKEGYVSVPEALEAFNMTRGHLYRWTKDTDIQSITYKGKAYYKLSELEAIILPNLQEEISDWYTVEEIMQKFGLSKQYVYDLVSELQIPKRRRGKNILISRFDWDRARGLEGTELDIYYTLTQISKKYNARKNDIMAYARRWNVPTMLKDKLRLYQKEGIDHMFDMINKNKLCQQPK
ncbi:MAG: helix-turn-helix domain-containing protein [Bacteroidales bacterium]|nr:helix-turn-helix domain-containing protein [Bacteroidales bacterium]